MFERIGVCLTHDWGKTSVDTVYKLGIVFDVLGYRLEGNSCVWRERERERERAHIKQISIKNILYYNSLSAQ